VYRSAWCEVDLRQFHENLSVLRRNANTRALLVVKANAYGHGLLRMALEAERAKIDMLGVATIGEAGELLAGGVHAPVLIMCALDHAEIDYCVANGIHFMAWSVDHFRQAAKSAAKYGKQPHIHLEIDTGMSRSGIVPSNLIELLDCLSAADLKTIVGVMTHFHSADLEDNKSSESQLSAFRRCVERLAARDIRPLVHAANSPGTLRLPESRLDMVRLGIAAYGLPPSEYTTLPPGVRPVLSWHARVTNVKTVHAGTGVGYGWQHIAEGDQRIATLAVGYADGYRRSPRGCNTVIVQGVEAPVVGSVFMDQCVFVIPTAAVCEVGCAVVLMGSQLSASLTAEKLAERWLTNNYDVVAGIRSRVPRCYVSGPSRTS